MGSASGNPSATPPAEHSTASEVNPSVRACSPSAIRGGRADAVPNPDAVEGNPLVADESDQPGQGDPADMLDLLRVDQAGDGFVTGDDGRHRDHRDHERPGQVLDATESVGISASGGLGAQRERDPQRHRGQRISEVVDGVGGQRNRPRHHHDHNLDERGQPENQQADLDRTDPCRSGFQGVVDAVGGVVGVRREDLLDHRRHTS